MKIRKNFIIFLTAISLLFLAVYFSAGRLTLAQFEEKIPPRIFDVLISDITTSSVMISWKTDKDAAIVNYGLDKNYGVSRAASFGKKHEILIDGLLSGTNYFIRLSSSDAANNQNIAGGYFVLTKGESAIKELKETKTLPEDIIKLLEEIKDPELLKKIAEKLDKVSEDVVDAPNIIGGPRLEIGADYTIFYWKTDKESGSVVSLAKEGEYDPLREDPYIWNSGDPEEAVTDHEVRVEGLKPATLYHYQVSSKARLGSVGKSEDRTFVTKSVLPEIRNVRVDKVEETVATISWVTAVPASGLVEYINLKTKETKSKGNPVFATAQSIQLTELEFNTSYSAKVVAENEAGDKMTSAPITFLTVKDEAPPVISKVNNESTLYPGADVKIQTVVSWDTDEPAICQFFYQQGLAPGSKEESFLKESNYLIRHVQVLTAFMPATVYKFWIKCEDKALNESRSEDFVLFTPEKEKSIIDIIIENFQGAFGWMKKIKK